VDPHPTRIARWFGDTELEEREHDDYFQRQDLDPHWIANEEKYNRELVELVNQHAAHMAMIFSTSVAPSVTKRAMQTGSRFTGLIRFMTTTTFQAARPDASLN